MITLILSAYFGILIVLAVYGVHRIYITRSALQGMRQPVSSEAPKEWPFVTIQLPLFNEKFVVDQLLEAAAAIDYPKERLEIQILDDSTDETQAIIQHKLAQFSGDIPFVYRHRSIRTGYKAGALADGLADAKGEFVAIFDADFLPQPEFLKQVMGAFQDPQVGMVQTRWGHLNRDENVLTQVQALMLDAHFVLEHAGRYQRGFFFNFNGTAGVWRKSAILEAGGWQHDTLTEDLDLSYRAQLCGWKFVFLPHVVCPAELPSNMPAFKSQQHRWAKGSIEVMLKLLPTIWRSNATWGQKLEATFHLTGNMAYLLMVVNSLFFVIPSLFIRVQTDWYHLLILDAPLFAMASISFIYFYITAQRLVGQSTGKALRLVPALMAIGIGLGVNNARAVLEALFRRRSGFIRTPKQGTSQPKLALAHYRVHPNLWTSLECVMALAYVAALAWAILHGWWASIPFLMLFLNGFGAVGWGTLRAQWAPKAT
ncbi:MAG: glycosyltransferase [Acidobacteria bacterium]|nr:glycosyltransferase [Acidobacteriota bacterium]MCB9398180.1 glycosyltransferase [Acidobacteriota bacterium]